LNKLVAVSGIVIILLGSVCGVLYYQISGMQSQIGDLENQNSALEGQVSEYQNQTSQLENQIDTLEKQIDDFPFQLNHLEYKIDSLEAQNLELQNQKTVLERELEVKSTNLVRITEFNVTRMNFIGGLAALSYVNITVENFGTNDVDGLVIHVDPVDKERVNAGVQVGLLKSGEAQTINTEIIWGFQSEIRTFVATLMLDDVILQERNTTLVL
jgi:hypothetical protein